MKLNLFGKWALSLVLSILLFSCQDHALPTSKERFRLKKTVLTTIQGATTTTYNYNTNGQLANYVTLSGTLPGTPSLTTVLFYDAQNRLIRAEDPPGFFRVVYDYDQNGRIRFIKVYSDPKMDGSFDSSREQFELEYDGSSQFPVRSTSTVNNVFPIPITKTVYTYSNGNVVQVDVSFSDPNGFPSSSTIQYDDKPNPYFGLINFGTNTGLRPDIRTFSRNNAIRSGETLIYDARGLLIGLNVISTNSRFNSQTTYEYEVY